MALRKRGRSPEPWRSRPWRALGLAIAALSGAAGCGGGGGSSGPVLSDFERGIFEPASRFDALCALPRGAGFPDRQGTVEDENNWLRAWSNDLYLWYDEITDEDPAAHTTPEYFDLMKTFATTPSGAPKDRFHFTYPTDEWQALSQSGVAAGYGAEFAIITASPPRQVVIAYTEPGTPATVENLVRGTQMLAVDGVTVLDGDSDALNAGFFPASTGESHTFTVMVPGEATSRMVTMTSTLITSVPVQNVATVASAAGPVGYMLFNDHIATAEAQLIDAIDQLIAANVTDLVLDIRYNGGGYLDIANELAYMVAGSAALGQTFEEIRFNDKHPTVNPVTGATLAPMPFRTTTVGFSTNPGIPLPSLDLPRVFVLTGPNTCSASESIINALRGINVEVIQVGSTTCGKPYGFYPADNCGTTYFSVQFEGVNALGFGDYTDGFSPMNVAQIEGTPIPGCSVADDFTHALGDPVEGRFAAALQYRADGTCPVPSGFGGERSVQGFPSAPLSAVDGYVPKSVWLQNRILSR